MSDGAAAARSPSLADADRVAPAGSLVVVSTPIGNLGDISERAALALRVADLIACEDTRRTGKLLSHLGISGVKLLRLDKHRERAGVAAVVDVLAGRGRVALVSDAGTPAVSDPGERLVAAVVEAGHEVRAVPGPSAALAALVVSGLPTDRFTVEGFLPRRGRARTERLDVIAVDTRTTVVFESPHRSASTLSELAVRCDPERRVALCRELTKLHEEVWRGSLAEACEQELDARGELVIVIEGADPTVGAPDEIDVESAVRDALDRGLSRRDAVAEVAAGLGVPKNDVYDVALRL
jgi:16S rRNA (cytidine1402-2'-O)-methyltransferase